MKRRKKLVWVAVISIVLLGGIAGGVFYYLPEPPVQVMEKTRVALNDAKEKKANLYNKKLHEEALVLYDSAMAAWKRENGKFFLFRDYKKAIAFAGEAKKKAERAGELSEKNERVAKDGLEEGVKTLRDKAKSFDAVYLNIPMSASIKKKQAKGKLLLNETEVAFTRGDYKEGSEKFQEAKRNIEEAYREAESVVETYFSALPTWQKKLNATLDASKKNGSYVIVVEKFPPCCCVYYKGILKEEFKAELGKNWLGDKRREGDDATPEGMYKVTKKLGEGKTKYYKALLLDYPNAEDRERFRQLKKAGEISSSAGIGSLIEVHGGGGKGVHWTNGCVALTDKDMDKIYKYAGVGTMVTIIGASKPWKEIIDEYKRYETAHE